MNSGNDRRHSKALEPELLADADARAQAEAANGLRQFDAAVSLAHSALERGGAYKLRASAILALHREALKGISNYAGNYRPGSVEITKSRHTPPEAHLVPELIEDMCDYVSDHWENSTAIHLAAYVMWRLNWIHPFADGNGRTSRILSYLVLNVRSGYILPGTPTIPDQIVDDRSGYFAALDAADAAFRETVTVDVSKMEELLGGMLARQLMEFYKSTGARLPVEI